MDLWQQMLQVAQKAQAGGHLLSINNEFRIIEDDGIPFVIRYAPNLIEKIRASAAPRRDNPFLPPEPELTVAPVGDRHQLILNKFNVLPVHGLIITNQFVEQTDQLMLHDFSAIADILDRVDGFIFYNGGEKAGASQRHRHFQLVPKDLGAGVLPIADAVEQYFRHQRKSLFPFTHRLLALPDWRGETLLDAWQKLEFAWQPYNLLLTRDWMLVIPRCNESSCGISINSLGFAGGLLAKDTSELAVIDEQGPLSLLSGVVPH